MAAQGVDYALLSTTTSLGRVRGFTIDLLFHLREGPRRCCELVEITGKPEFYVRRYLKNMQNYGLVEKNDFLWNLSEIGVNFLLHLDIVYNNIIEYRKKQERKKKETIKKQETSKPKRLKQIRFDLWLQNSSLSDAEKEVVEALTGHYSETGSKFILVKNQFELAERLGKNPDVLLEALKRLVQDNIIYLFRSQLEGHWKIGLKKAFVEALQKQEP